MPSELRKDPLSDRWVIIASHRAGRPNEFVSEPWKRLQLACPFCAGHESETPPTLLALPAGEQPWQVRVVANKYPALIPAVPDPNHPGTSPAAAEAATQPAAADRSPSLFCRQTATGRHEIVIESPRHISSFSQLNLDQAGLVFQAYRDRLRFLGEQDELRAGIIFKNVGAFGGASLEHLHSQIVGLPMVPANLQQECDALARGAQQFQQCLLCSMLEAELADGARVVSTTANFTAFCPYASRFAYEVWILPRQHQSDYRRIADLELVELANLARDLVARLERCHPQPSYNYFLHSAPFDTRSYDHYHWHIEMFPRLTRVAGFEWGSGCHINPVAPEDAARFLREAGGVSDS